MTGPEHYREAERLAEAYKQAHADIEAMPADTDQQRMNRLYAQGNARALLEKAQLHATLAHTAAAIVGWVRGYTGDSARDWVKAVS